MIIVHGKYIIVINLTIHLLNYIIQKLKLGNLTLVVPVYIKSLIIIFKNKKYSFIHFYKFN